MQLVWICNNFMKYQDICVSTAILFHLRLMYMLLIAKKYLVPDYCWSFVTLFAVLSQSNHCQTWKWSAPLIKVCTFEYFEVLSSSLFLLLSFLNTMTCCKCHFMIFLSLFFILYIMCESGRLGWESYLFCQAIAYVYILLVSDLQLLQI